MSANASKSTFPCHLCGGTCEEIPEYRSFRRIASDCRPWKTGGCLGVCTECGSLQKRFDSAWQKEIDEIYTSYDIYHWSEGTEQAIFEANSSQALLRSEKIVEQLGRAVPLGAVGSLLDIGCGNGAFLRAFHSAFPDWTLSGSELDAKYAEKVKEIPGVKEHYTCAPADIPGEFQIVVLIHVLEHIANPVEFLRAVGSKVAPGGHLLVEIPSYESNPFDLMIADHSTHFDLASASRLLERAGFDVVVATSSWIQKELTLLARRGRETSAASGRSAAETLSAAKDCLKWLAEVRQAAKDLAGKRPLGLFGTANAATWLASEIEGKFDFFVDENPNIRVKTYMGKPVYKPGTMPAGSHIFIPLAPEVAEAVVSRLGKTYPEQTFYRTRK